MNSENPVKVKEIYGYPVIRSLKIIVATDETDPFTNSNRSITHRNIGRTPLPHLFNYSTMATATDTAYYNDEFYLRVYMGHKSRYEI